MNESFSRNLRVLVRTEAIIAEIRLRHLVARLLWRVGAGVMALLATVMLNAASYLALIRVWEPAWAALAVAVGDLAVALIGLLTAGGIKPGQDLAFALDVRNEALSFVEADARLLADDAIGLVTELRSVRQTLGSLVRHPFDNAIGGIILPLATTLLKNLRKPDAAG